MDEEIIFRIEIPEESITSLENLTKANKSLREERKKLNLETAEGQKRAQEINKQLDANTNVIKANSSALEKQRLNVGNYSGALDKLVPGLGATITGFQGMTKSALAFIATPIGAVIGALGLAIGALTAYFKGSEEGQNNFNKIVKVGTVVIGNLLDIVRDFGAVIFKVFTGDFKGAYDSLKETFNGVKNIVSETRSEIEKGLSIENLRAETDLLERSLIVLRAKNEAEIASLKLKAEDRSLSTLERQEALNKAIELQNELSDKAVQVAKNRLLIKQEENALSDSTKEDLNEEAELQAKLSLVEKDRADKSKEIVTKQQALRQESIALLEKERDAIVAAHLAEIMREADSVIRAAAEEERHQRELEQINERIQAYVSEEEQLRRRIDALDLEADITDESTQANIDYTKELKRLTLAEQFANMVTQSRAGLLMGLSNFIKTVAGENKAAAALAITLEKAAAISQIVSSTGIANAKAVAVSPVTFGQPWVAINTASAALSIGTAIASAAKALGEIGGFFDGGLVGYAGGGLSGTRIMGHHGRPIRRSNGDNMLATVKTGEVILNERQQARLGGSETFRRIGVPGFASGGFTGAIARQSEASASQREIFEAIAKLRPIVTVEDINLGQQRVEIVEQRAQVL